MAVADDEKGRGKKEAADEGQLLAAAARDFQALWLSLAQRPWKSLVVIPVDVEFSVAEHARTLTDIGAALSEGPVTCLCLDDLAAPGDVNTGADRARTKAIVNRIRTMSQGTEPGQIVIALQAVTTHPLGVLIARTADVVVLCVRMEQSRVQDVRETMTLIGADKIAGCLLLE